MLFWDVETASEADLPKVGAHVYAEHPSTRIVNAGFALGDQRAVWHPGEPLPAWVEQAMLDPAVLLGAFNEEFDRTVWNSKSGTGIRIAASRSVCLAARARVAGVIEDSSKDGAPDLARTLQAFGIAVGKDTEAAADSGLFSS